MDSVARSSSLARWLPARPGPNRTNLMGSTGFLLRLQRWWRLAMAARQETLALSRSATTPSRGPAAPIQRIHSDTDRSSALSFTKCDEHPHASENQSYVLYRRDRKSTRLNSSHVAIS